jgi:lysophospholipase L1-like esterase
VDSGKRLWLYTGLALAAGVGLVSAASKPKTLPEPIKPVLKPGSKVLLIGDSFAQGLAPPLKQLFSEHGMLFLADGRIGSTIQQWASQPWLDAALAKGKPDVVLVSLGTNDMKLVDPMLEKPALANLVSKLKQSAGSIVWISPPSLPFPDRGVRSMLADMPAFHSEALSIPRGPDAIHPNIAGYAGWAGALFRWLVPAPVALGKLPRARRTKRLDEMSPYRRTRPR